MKKIFLCAFLFVMGMGLLLAQQPKINFTADHDLLMKKIAEHPEVLEQLDAYEQNIQAEIQAAKKGLANTAKGTTTDTLLNGLHVIPVVFHIIHNNGPENISDEQIMSSLTLLNIDYSMRNADTVSGVNTYAGFCSRRANPKIEFRLARLDPDGNPTSGIVRHEASNANAITYTDMPQYAWDASKYLNVFSVGGITVQGMGADQGTIIGMSLFPPTNPLTAMFTTDPNCDGVLIRHDAIGNVGTAENLTGYELNAQNRSFTHELGHYFNLYHPFQNLNENMDMNDMNDLMDFYMQQMSGTGCDTVSYMGRPLYGDYVDDTPPVTAATQNSDFNCFEVGSVNTCTNDVPGYGDEPDMIENYMDYQWGFCANMFTLGQLERINVTLNGYRRNLWSYENLVATGVLDYNDIAEMTMEQGFELYPNPTEDILNIKAKNVNNTQEVDVHIFDISGKLLQQLRFTGETLRVNISDYPSGIYFLKAGSETLKFIKK